MRARPTSPLLGLTSASVCFGLVSLSACGGSPAAHEADASQVSISIDPSQRYQTLEGFGAAIAWYDDWVTRHPNKAELYDVIFGELGLDILRLRNRFRYQTDFSVESAEIVAEGSRSIGRDLTVLMSSWSPPGELKASGIEDCTEADAARCTLRRIDGEFPYAAFADYWSDALDAYAALGINPKFISLQNEPDFRPPSWEGCFFAASETADTPGYGLALDAVYQRLAERAQPPLILGPETIGLQNNRVQHYAEAMDMSKLSGIAHHLYDGDRWQSPDSFLGPMRSLSAAYPDHPIFQTEFSANSANGGAFETAWLIHNALVGASAAAYMYWDLIWEGGGLVAPENPFDESTWQTENGYVVRPPYYSVKHFAKFTDPGFVRVGASTTSSSIKVSAFESPAQDRLTIVLLNVGELSRTASLDFDTSAYTAELYLTTPDSNWQTLAAGSTTAPFVLPGRSIATLSLTRS